MSKVAIVYWSGTGNTEKMAYLIAEGIKESGSEVTLYTAEEFTSNLVNEFDKIAFGCPSMGDEQLEESIFEPMFSSVMRVLKDKKIALFGSFGWGDGAWMRSWEDLCISNGLKIAADSVIANNDPDDEAAEACRQLGRELTLA